MLTKDEFFSDSDETEIRIPFFIFFSVFWNIFDGICTLRFFIHGNGLEVT